MKGVSYARTRHGRTTAGADHAAVIDQLIALGANVNASPDLADGVDAVRRGRPRPVKA